MRRLSLGKAPGGKRARCPDDTCDTRICEGWGGLNTRPVRKLQGTAALDPQTLRWTHLGIMPGHLYSVAGLAAESQQPVVWGKSVNQRQNLSPCWLQEYFDVCEGIVHWSCLVMQRIVH